MNTLKLTAADFTNGEYTGKTDLSVVYDGSIEIAASLGWVRFRSLRARVSITAGPGTGIEAGYGIKAGGGIEAGYGIKAGGGIEAGEGIEAGLSIRCKLSLTIAYRIFAGTATWKKSVTHDEILVECGRLESGEIVHGELVELGMPGATTEAVNTCEPFRHIVLDGTEYELHPVGS